MFWRFATSLCSPLVDSSGSALISVDSLDRACESWIATPRAPSRRLIVWLSIFLLHIAQASELRVLRSVYVYVCSSCLSVADSSLTCCETSSVGRLWMTLHWSSRLETCTYCESMGGCRRKDHVFASMLLNLGIIPPHVFPLLSISPSSHPTTSHNVHLTRD